MEYDLRPYEASFLSDATQLWNEIVEEGASFPGEVPLTPEEAERMFSNQTATVCAMNGNRVIGLYILHPNGIGRLSHIANASYAVKKECRGLGLGRVLVLDSIEKARENLFAAMQFNAVVAVNTRALNLYLKLGFTIVGTIKNGYRLKNGDYSDMLIFLKSFH